MDPLSGGGKLFAAVCKGDSGEDELVTLKLEPQEGAFLREQYEEARSTLRSRGRRLSVCWSA